MSHGSGVCAGRRTRRHDSSHTYYVLAGNTPVLVHNSGCGPFTADQLQQATDYATSESKLAHIIDPDKHGFGDVVQAAGGRTEAMQAIVDSLNDGSDLPTSGVFEVSRTIYGESVTIRGAVVDGVPRIGTAFIPSAFPGAGS